MTEAHNIDCMEAMAQMKDNEFDLAIVDPPYGIKAHNGSRVINRNKTWDSARDRDNIIKGNWDNDIPPSEYFMELFRVSKEQIIWGAIILIFPEIIIG